jgi:hypothetical protein
VTSPQNHRSVREEYRVLSDEGVLAQLAAARLCRQQTMEAHADAQDRADDLLLEAVQRGLDPAAVVTGTAAGRPSEQREVNPFAEALDYLWGELTVEQTRALPPDIAQACRANHEALCHPPGWDDPIHSGQVRQA